MAPVYVEVPDQSAPHHDLMAIRRREWAVLGVFLGLVLLFGLNFKLVTLDGQSMEPTFHNHQTVLLWRTAALFGGNTPGDVVVFRSTEGDYWIKRVVFIQNAAGTRRMPESFWTPHGYLTRAQVLNLTGNSEFPGYLEDIAAAGHGIPVTRTLYVMGDNTWLSEDSREIGGLRSDQILGRVVGVLPFEIDGLSIARSHHPAAPIAPTIQPVPAN